MSEPNNHPRDPADGPHPEDPNRFPEGEVAPLDEPPDGHTPGEATESSAGSLPPGAGQKPE